MVVHSPSVLIQGVSSLSVDHIYSYAPYSSTYMCQSITCSNVYPQQHAQVHNQPPPSMLVNPSILKSNFQPLRYMPNGPMLLWLSALIQVPNAHSPR